MTMEEAPPPEEGGNILTRPIGPLPLWAWAAVIVGGYFLYRLLTGGGSSSTGTSVGFTSGGTTGTGGTDTGNTGSFDPSGLQSEIDALVKSQGDMTSQLADALTTIQAQAALIAQQSGNIGLLQTGEQLQEQLTQATGALDTLLGQQAAEAARINTLKNVQNRCTTTACHDSYQNTINILLTQYNALAPSIATARANVTSLESQIAQNTAAISISPPPASTPSGGTSVVSATTSGSVPTISTGNSPSTPITV